MVNNPWEVESLQAFQFLKCPECTFDTKEENFFQMHAVNHHPLSIVFFDETCKKKPTNIKERTAKVKSDPVFLIEIDGETLIKPKKSKSSALNKCSKSKELNENIFESIQTGNVGNGRTFGPDPPISMDNGEHDTEHMEEVFENEIPKGSKSSALNKCSKSKELNENIFESIQTGNVENERTFGPDPPIPMDNGEHDTEHMEDDFENEIPEFCRQNFYIQNSSEEGFENETPEFGRQNFPEESMIRKEEKIEVKFESVSVDINDSIQIKTLIEPPGESNKCSFCNVNFSSLSDVNRHIEFVHEGKKPYKCERKKLVVAAKDCKICGASFKKHYTLKAHVFSAHKGTDFYDGRDYKCSICDRASTSEYGLKTHIKTVHGGKKPHKCLICPMSFSTKYRVEVHTKTVHETDNAFKCTLCKSSYKAEMNLKRHITTVHEKKNTFACFNCDDSFVLRKELQAHMELAHDQKYNCPKCDMSSSNKTSIMNHIKYVHEKQVKVKSHKCSTCDVSFASSTSLKEHIDAVHEKKKPHLCPLCGSSFAASSALKTHIENVHEGKKTCVCSICGKAFYSTHFMKRHFRIVHEGIKEKKEVLSCPHCDAMIKGKHALKIHIESVHEKKRFTCTICNHTYSRKSNMIRHISTDHKNKQN